MIRRRTWLSALFMAITVVSLTRTAAGQNADRRTGVTLFQEGTAIGETYIHVRRSRLYDGSDRVSDPTDRRFEANIFATNLSYGATPDLTLGLTVPYVEKDLKHDAVTGRLRLGDSGLGDLSALAKYRFLKIDGPRRTLQVSALLGLEFPTGETDERDGAGTRLPPPLQLGSGSFDPLFGVAATQVLGRFFVSGSVFYKLNLEGSQDFKAGDLLTLDLGGGYRFYQAKFPGPEAGASLGLSWEYAGRAQQDGDRVRDSGGNELFVGAGLFFAPRPDLVFRIGVQVPLYRDLHGQQLGTDVVATAGFEFRF